MGKGVILTMKSGFARTFLKKSDESELPRIDLESTSDEVFSSFSLSVIESST